MKISSRTIKELSEINNSIYNDLKVEFLFHSNKLEGSTFDIQQLNCLLEEKKVVGEHSVDDVQTTINSMELFDFVVKTLNENITSRLLCEWHSLLMKNTTLEERGYTGRFKTIPNHLVGVDIKTAEPYEVSEKIQELLEKDINDINDIAFFHQEFEHIHPFQDGNGRIGRFLILKQCIENNIDLIAIDNMYNKQYKDSLYIAQTQNDLQQLVNVFKDCQKRLDEKMEKYKPYIDVLNNRTINRELFDAISNCENEPDICDN